MILVTVGTNEAPFDRLVAAFDGASLGEPLVVQHGSSRIRPAGATCVDFFAFDELIEHIRTARAVVAHAGVGTIMSVVAEGIRPYVVPRLHRFREAVDDHQVPLARRFHESGLVTLVEDPDALPAILEAPAMPGEGCVRSPASIEASDGLVHELRTYLAAEVDVPRRSPLRVNGGRPHSGRLMRVRQRGRADGT